MLKRSAHHMTYANLNNDLPGQMKDDFDLERFQDIFRDAQHTATRTIAHRISIPALTPVSEEKKKIIQEQLTRQLQQPIT